MFMAIAIKMVHPWVPIFDETFNHLEWFLTDSVSTVGFQCYNRNQLIYVHFELYVTSNEKV